MRTPLDNKIQELFGDYAGVTQSEEVVNDLKALAQWVLDEIARREGWEETRELHAQRLGIISDNQK